MADTYSSRYGGASRPQSINASSNSSSNQYSERRSEQSPEPTFRPTGLLGNRYDFLKQEMETRSQASEQQTPQSPFTGGLLQSLADLEIEQRLEPTALTRLHNTKKNTKCGFCKD
ncbi:hypothetical protein FHETE_865 [Fusarium heterosporum]|uniref:Uncharacterized protein n=1 Tax=Fusarium heterosporum TaxID=42747 RepID=A0A8H5TZ47_FUSHE|nr:hypothetical protein FHETE_865 [Fusarium heterosporum]